MDIEIRLPKLHKAQKEIVDNLARFNVVICGRRFGKTQLLTDIAINDVLDGKRVAYFTPTHRMGSEVWRTMTATLRPLTSRLDNNERRIETITGGLFEAWSLQSGTAQSVRGRKYHRLIMDEAAFIRSGSIWQETLRALLTDYQGGAIFASTPKGQNWLYILYRMGVDPLEPDWKSFHYTTRDNPFIPPGEVDDAKRSLPELVYKQEYLAEFIANEGLVFRGAVDASTLKPQLHQIYDHRYVGGIDWARDEDFTVATVIDATTLQQVDQIRFNQIGWNIQREKVMQMHQKWNCQTWWGESNSIGGPNIEALQSEGLPITGFATTAQSKRPLIEALALAIERKELTLLDDEIQLFELTSYTYERLPGGGFQYSAPSGMHDDCVISLALAYHGIAASDVPAMTIGRFRSRAS